MLYAIIFANCEVYGLSAKWKMEMNEIEIKFMPQERDLIIDHTFTGPDLTKRLQIAEINLDQRFPASICVQVSHFLRLFLKNRFFLT